MSTSYFDIDYDLLDEEYDVDDPPARSDVPRQHEGIENVPILEDRQQEERDASSSRSGSTSKTNSSISNSITDSEGKESNTCTSSKSEPIKKKQKVEPRLMQSQKNSIEKQLQREYIRTNRYYCASGKTKDNPGSNAAQLIYPNRTLYSLDCKHRLAKRISIGNYFDCTHDPDSYRTKPCFIIFEDKGKPLLKAVR
ncbi:hypothetical protein U1Q18_051474 [Sarracenia purpurea var. burkii]